MIYGGGVVAVMAKFELIRLFCWNFNSNQNLQAQVLIGSSMKYTLSKSEDDLLQMICQEA